MKKKGLFITGTDTDVGKTYICTQIIRQLSTFVAPIKVRKPIESGCEKNQQGVLQPHDGQALWQANQKQETLEIVTPYRFAPAIAPDRAAKLNGKNITIDQLKQACLEQVNHHDFLIVEGAGGFYSPLANDGLNADLAKALDLDIALVVKDQLGCLNHTLLTLQAIESKGLHCKIIILNYCSELHHNIYDHYNEIKARTTVPVIRCFENEQLDDITQLFS